MKPLTGPTPTPPMKDRTPVTTPSSEVVAHGTVPTTTKGERSRGSPDPLAEVQLPKKDPTPERVSVTLERGRPQVGPIGIKLAGGRPSAESALDAVRRGEIETLRGLVRAGLDVNARDGGGMTPLLLAAVRGDLEAMQLLLEAGARVDVAHGRSGALPLHMAASGGNVDAIKLLLAHGASLEAHWPINGHTPLVEAIFKNNAAAALALLDAGADPTAVTIRGVGTMDLALRNPTLNSAIIDRLDSAFVAQGAPERRDAQGNVVQANGHPVHDLDAAQKRSTMLAIFGEVAPQDAGLKPAPRTDADFVQALTLARAGDVEGLRALLDRDPSIVTGRGGDAAENLVSTPLIFAAIAGRTEVVRLLLERGADANLAEVHPMAVTALFKAAVFGHTEIARLLIGAGARLDDQGVANGMTPLHDAVLQNRPELVRLFLQSGARSDIEDYTGASARQFAAQRGSPEVQQVFRELVPGSIS